MFGKGVLNKKGNCFFCDGSKKCYICGGTGKNPYDKNLDCPACDGSGKCFFCLPKPIERKNERGWAGF